MARRSTGVPMGKLLQWTVANPRIDIKADDDPLNVSYSVKNTLP